MEGALNEKSTAECIDTPLTGNPAEQKVSEIAALLRSLDETAANSGRATPQPPTANENRLIQVRLGIASALFMALRSKHAPTAAHSLRVALGSSTWTMLMNLSDQQRDHLEVAALLHDIGKIGIPDHILQKPGKLSAEETAIVDQHPRLGIQILSCCSAPPEQLDIIRYSTAWYDGSKPGFNLRGKDLPLGARIVAIVDAFDAMTTDHVYRRALSREQALVELYEHAGTQFDPDLVRAFSDLHDQNHIDLHAKVAQRWLKALAPELANEHWQLSAPGAQPSQVMSQTLFQQKLLDNMHDGVVFVDSQLQIFLWNHGAERLSGIASTAACQRKWLPSLLQMRDERGSIIQDHECPVASAVLTGVQSTGRLSIGSRAGTDAPIDLQAIPVIGRDGTTYGATLLLYDASSEQSLEQRCQNLHSQATKDPLTQVANRAEFERVHELFIETHIQSRLPCSLIICDIDHFKHVNDNYGHQAGDEAIKTFAALLKSYARHGDLVARYGGEEFVMLCADCNNAAAYARAEQMRRALAEFPQLSMGNRHITASFGCTENQSGDTPGIMLRRADRALLEAKSTGRNKTVQLGTGVVQEERRRGWSWLFSKKTPDALLQTHLVSNVPMKIIVEKLRGFIADHQAQILATTEDRIEIAIEGTWKTKLRRRGDRAVPLQLEIKLTQPASGERTERDPAPRFHTSLHVTIRPRRNRDRRIEHATERARHLLASLKSYLVAHEETYQDDAFQKAKRTIVPWLAKKS